MTTSLRPIAPPRQISLDEAIAGRRSVREFEPDPLDDAEIRALIDAAVLAPSATNAQTWAFTVVRDQGLLDRLSDAAKAHLLADLPATLDNASRRARLADPEFDIFYDAPALILISGTQAGPWVVENCALAAENLMLAAFARGLGSCWIGYAQRYLNTDDGKALLGLPAESLPVAPIIVGRPRVMPEAKPRSEPEVRWLG